MAKYNRRYEPKPRKWVSVVVSLALSVVTLVVGVVYHEPIANAFGVTFEKESGTPSVGGEVTETEYKDLSLMRSYVRNVPNGGFEFICEYNVTDTYLNTVLSSEDKVFISMQIDYAEYERLAEEGFEHEEIISSMANLKGEEMEMTRNEWLSYAFDKSVENSPQVVMNESGDLSVRFRFKLSSSMITYETLNTRLLRVMAVLEKGEDGTVTFNDIGDFGGRAYDDMDVSGSIAYYTSRELNRLRMADASYNADLLNVFKTKFKEACCLSAGQETADITKVTFCDEAEVYKTVEMTVGEEKTLEIVCPYDVDYRVDFRKEFDEKASQYGGITVTNTGKVTALKAGTYKLNAYAFGQRFHYTINVVEGE